ncbi:MAG: hypothetical protein OYH77_04295 [Pseudomonadota bacterium]|nr:hypothetical protein [Pseudomonadota bacterium]
MRKIIKDKSLYSRVAQRDESDTYKLLLEEESLVERLSLLLSKYNEKQDINYLIEMASIHERLADIEEKKVASLRDNAKLNREVNAALESFDGR